MSDEIHDTPAESPTAKRLLLSEPTARQRISSIPAERPPLPDNPSWQDLAKAYMGTSAAYHQVLTALNDHLASIDARLALRNEAPAVMPKGYRVLWTLVVLLSIRQALDLWQIVSAHFGR